MSIATFSPNTIEDPGLASRAAEPLELGYDVARFYEYKTAAVLRRYGPGPRVHYRTGFADAMEVSNSIIALKQQIHESQERVLYHASEYWRIRNVTFRDVLDVGCGLGGGAIFWAQEFGARVTGVTIAPTHVDLIVKFAAQARVSSLVHPMLCDASSVPGKECFDAVVALDSSDTFARLPWFTCMSRVLRPHGRVFVYDCFLERPEYAEPINQHWYAQLGTIDEYLSAADRAGFRPELFEDVSHRTRDFWTLTIALARAEEAGRLLDSVESARVEESLWVHELVREGLSTGGLRYALMSFTKR